MWSSRSHDPVGVLKMRVQNTREVTGVVRRGTVGVVLWWISGCGQEEIYRCGWEGSEAIIDKTEHWYSY